MKLAKSKLTKALGMAGLVALAVLSSPLAIADDAGWYLGANVGQSGAVIDDAKITSNLLAGGLTVTSISDSDRDTGFKLFGGYQFNKYLGVEGGYFDLGKFGYTANASSPSTLLLPTPVTAGTLTGELKVKGLNLDLVATLPITEKFSVFGRAGVIYAQTDDTFTGTGSVHVFNPNPSVSETNYKFGGGLQYAFTQRLAMRLEAERYRINDAVGSKGDIDLVSLGLVYRFGAKTPAPAPRVMAPEPVREVIAVAPPPPPAPPAPPPPPPPRYEKITLSATELFGFNSAELRMPQPKLDEFASAMISNRDVHDVDITGYSDRIGSAKYNQKLSEHRAVAVKDYLVSKGIDANRLKAAGKGEANPVVVCTDKKRPALIKCLEPNRRVEVEQITIERRVK